MLSVTYQGVRSTDWELRETQAVPQKAELAPDSEEEARQQRLEIGDCDLERRPERS